MTEVTLRPMTLDDYDVVYPLWLSTPGLGVTEADSREGLSAFLLRNPEFSWVAVSNESTIVGTVLCGHDGRRGFLYHLVVVPEWRNRGVAQRLVANCLSRLHSIGIQKCNLFMFRDNELGAGFWANNGWCFRNDLSILQRLVME